MTLDVEVGARRYRVVVAPYGRGTTRPLLRITLQALDSDGAQVIEQVVDAHETSLGVSLVHAEGGRVVDAALTGRGGGETLVQLGHTTIAVVTDGRRRLQSGNAAGQISGHERICAPMPGRVVRVLVAVDEWVVAGQPLVVIEAMKMENALTAGRDGRIREVAVSAGSSVEAGRLLLVVV